MAINDGLATMAPIIDGFYRGGVLNPGVYGAFAHAVMASTDSRATPFPSSPGCGTGYDSHKPELQFWFFGLMLCEYVIGLMAKKCEEGHCNVHRLAPAFTACPKTRPTHIDVLKSFKGHLNALVTELDAKISELSRLPAV